MKFITFLFSLACIYALVQAKGDDVGLRREYTRESPLRKALRVSPVTETTPLVRVRPNKTVLRQSVVRQQPVVVREEEVVVRDEPTLVRQEPTLVRQEPAVVRQETVVVRQEPTVVRQEPVLVRQVVQRPRQRQYNVIRQTQAPLEVRPVEVVRTVVQERPVVLAQEQVEQGADDTDEDVRGNSVQQQQQPQQQQELVRYVEQPAKLEVPQQNRRRFNVLLRTADGFNEKAGYSVSSRRTVVN